MIEKLERVIEQNYHDGLPIGNAISRPPNDEEIMNKINEIIEFLNTSGIEQCPPHNLVDDLYQGVREATTSLPVTKKCTKCLSQFSVMIN